MPTSVQ